MSQNICQCSTELILRNGFTIIRGKPVCNYCKLPETADNETEIHPSVSAKHNMGGRVLKNIESNDFHASSDVSALVSEMREANKRLNRIYWTIALGFLSVMLSTWTITFK